MAISLSQDIRNAQLDVITSVLGANARLKFYSGSVPASVGTALSGNTLIANLQLSASAAAAASSGVWTANAITADANADAAGTITFWRAETSGGVAKIQGTAGLTGADINLDAVVAEVGSQVSVSNWTITAPNA